MQLNNSFGYLAHVYVRVQTQKHTHIQSLSAFFHSDAFNTSE